MRRSIALAVTLTAGLLAAGTASAQKGSIHIGYFNWSDSIFTTNVVKYILEEKMDRDVEFTKANPAAIFQGVAVGDLDFHTDAWLPETHSDYFQKVAQQTRDVGPIYSGARLGWAVPTYIPEDEIGSIEDLKSEAIKEKLDDTIVGIGPGAGLTRLSKKAMDEYRLKDFGYSLQISSAPGMTAALERAINNKEWIVVTAWSPHWMFGRWDLRYIEDPKGTLGGLEHADILTRKGFYRDEPEVYELLDRITIPLEDVQAGQYQGEQTSYEEAAKQYVESRPEMVEYWVTGEWPQ